MVNSRGASAEAASGWSCPARTAAANAARSWSICSTLAANVAAVGANPGTGRQYSSCARAGFSTAQRTRARPAARMVTTPRGPSSTAARMAAPLCSRPRANSAS